RLSETDRDITVGQNTTATVTLSAAAPQGGAVINIVSSQPTAATVPASITIPAGSTTGTFVVTGAAPTTATGAVITVSVGSSQAVEALVVRAAPTPPVWTVAVDRNTVMPGGSFRVTLTLSAPAPAGGLPVRVFVTTPVNNAAWYGFNNDPLGAHAFHEGTVPAGQSTYVVTVRWASTIPNLPKQYAVDSSRPCSPPPCTTPLIYGPSVRLI